MSTEAFLAKKSTAQLIQEGLNLVQKLKQLNDNLNSNDPEDIQIVQEEINESKAKFQSSAQELKMIQQILDRQTLGIDQKAKVKQIKETYYREVQRNKTLISERINWMYENKALKDQRRQSYAQKRTSSNFRQSEVNYQQEQSQVDLIPIDELELDKMILEEKDQEINQLYQDAQELQKVVQDVSMQVNQQGESLEVIMDNQVKTKDNLVATNQELNQAATMQKSAGKKCWIILLISVVAAAILALILYFTLR